MEENQTEKEKEREDKVIRLLQTIAEQTKPKEHKEGSSKQEKHEHETHEHFKADIKYLDADDSCPECKAGLEKFGKAYMKKTLEARKDLPFECEECGLGVEEEEESCPNCGSREARER